MQAQAKFKAFWEWMKLERGLLLLSFALVFIKKWEPGGHIDATWYSAVAKNIARSGDFFHFSINPFFVSKLYDHFPLDYWIMGALMSLFGESDLVARSYFMFCSFSSFLIFYFLARKVVNREFAYLALVIYALCLGATKWSGAIKHDVPLTLAYLGCILFFLKGLERPKNLLWVAPFFALGVFAKGPVAFGVPLAFLLWGATTLNYRWLLQKEFWWAFLMILGFLALPFLPPLYFEGHNYYVIFYEFKKSYLKPDAQGDYFFFFVDIVRKQPHIFCFFLWSLFAFWRDRAIITQKQKQYFWLMGSVALSIMVPLSFFEFKLAYYLIPVMPFYAILSAYGPYTYFRKFNWDWSKGLYRVALAVILICVTFPIKTTGGRHKRVTNMVNQVKFIDGIQSMEVYFLGFYDEDMSIFQEFKYYGSIDLRPATRDDLLTKNPHQDMLVALRTSLPVMFGDFEVVEQSCWIKNSQYCVYLAPEKIRLSLPEWKWPHEDYR